MLTLLTLPTLSLSYSWSPDFQKEEEFTFIFFLKEKPLAHDLFTSHAALHFEQHPSKWRWIYLENVVPTSAVRSPSIDGEHLTVEANCEGQKENQTCPLALALPST